MADLFPLNNLLDGTRKLFVALMGKKTDGTYESIKTNDAGALKVSVADSIPAGNNNIGDVDLASAIPTGSNIIGKIVPVDVDGDEKFTISNPASVTLTGRNVAIEFTFQNAATATGEGTHMTLNGQDKVIVSISGTSTSRTISFKATGPNGVVGYVLGSKIGSAGSMTVSSGTTGTGEVWEIDGLAGYTDIFCSLDAVAGGNVTIRGKLVA